MIHSFNIYAIVWPYFSAFLTHGVFVQNHSQAQLFLHDIYMLILPYFDNILSKFTTLFKRRVND